jgi:hypothetical protein
MSVIPAALVDGGRLGKLNSTNVMRRTTLETDLAITPKRLGLIEIDTFCPRCYWYLLKQKFHPPFDHFGGAIFKSMEQAQMAIVGGLMEKDGCLPEEFAPFCDLVGRVEFPRNWREFKHRLDSGVLLYGEPDDICQVSDGSIAVIDFKTSRPKDGKDPLGGVYRIQILGYSFIAEFGLKLGEVSKGGLLYWGAEHEKVVADPDKYYRAKKLWMPFVPKPVAFDIDYKQLDAPLKEAVRLWEADAPPDGAKKCKDCKRLDTLLAIDTGVQELVTVSDQLMLTRSGNDPWVRSYVQQRINDRLSVRRSAWMDLQDQAGDLNFENDGLVANWGSDQLLG